MRARTPAAGEGGVSLFPFLAVLLCTMGALIVLLIVLADQSRRQASAAGSAQQDEFQQQIREAQWKQSVLAEAHDAAAAALTDANAELAYFEEQARAADAKLQSVLADARRHGDLLGGRRETQAADAAELEALRETLVQWQEEWERRKDAAPAKTAYSVVPYLGKYGTYRQPVYLECRADRIIFQPQGIELTDADFIGSLGPSSPLAIVMRATRRTIRQDAGGGRSLKEPYPLLLVRPDGIGAFYVAREVLANVDVHFGYELIDADWELSFPPADAQLAAVQAQALADARGQLRALVAAAPAQFSDEVRSVFAAAVGQDAEARAYGGGRGELRRGERGRRDLGRAAGGAAPWEHASTRGAAPSVEGRLGAEGESAWAVGEGSGADASELSLLGAGSGAAGDSASGASRPGEAPSAQNSADQNAGLASSPGGPSAGRNGAGGSQDISAGLESLTGGRRGAIPVTRPVVLQLRDGELRFTEGAPDPVPASDPRMPQRLAEAVGQRVERWGTAGRGMAWKPELVIHVGPGQESAYARVSERLRRLGVEVRSAGVVAQRDNPLR